MRIKRIKKLRVNSDNFTIKWDKTHSCGSFSYRDHTIEIGVRDVTDEHIFMVLSHELQEIVAVEMGLRFPRPDCEGDYMFFYDHRQHTSMMYMFAGLLSQFVE